VPDAEASATLARMISAAQLARMIAVAAELRISDLIKDGPRSCDELAAATSTHPGALYRLLRALASVGVFSLAQASVAQTALSELLRSDAEGSLRDLALFQNDEWYWQIYRDLPYSVRTGQPATEHLWGHGLFAYFAEHPQAARTFDAGMASRHASTNAALAAGFDFSGINTLVDVGGGNGALLCAILSHHPQMHGVLFDQPSVVTGAAQRLQEAGVDDRCQIVGGNFFDSVPSGGDAYILSNVLHDWHDAQAGQILHNIRDAMPRHGRVLVINEQVLAPGDEPHPGKLGDITMLLIGGRERTEVEWRALFEQAGLTFAGIAPLLTRTGAGVLEARRA
jgi:O-methyltransferase domain